MNFYLDQLSDEDKQVINTSILKGIADIEAGRYSILNDEYREQLKKRIRQAITLPKKTAG